MADEKKFAFDKTNFILLAAGMIVVIIGFLLMSGPICTEEAFEPDIFSVRRIKVAPVVCFLGFIFMIYAVMRKPKGEAVQAEAKVAGNLKVNNDAKEEVKA
jgi:membrane-bound ClpP family serine protease